MAHRANFEWNDAKAESNIRKHRVSFERDVTVFADPRHMMHETKRAQDGESRRKAIGMIEGRLFTLMFVMRGDVCRVISARRSNKTEEQVYASRDDRPE